MARAPFVIQPDLTGIAIAYKNEKYLADMIAPRDPVNAELFQVDFLELDTFFQIQDDTVGRLSKPNEVTWASERKEYSTVDHGLDSPVPWKDINNYQGVGPTPQAIATELVSEGVAINREVRVSQMVQNPNNYKAANRVVLSGTDQFSDYTNSDPKATVLAALDVPLVRPNTLVLSTVGWRILRQHPVIVETVKMTGAGSDAVGIAAREAVRELFELDNLWVGQARGLGMPSNLATANTVTPPRLWGLHMALITVDPLARLVNTNRPTFLMTAQHGNRVAGTIQEPHMGLEGGVLVRSGEKVKEVMISNEGSYFFENAFAV